MAKDDYYVIAYRILVYMYACLKRKITFEETTFNYAVRRHVENEQYFFDILNMMQNEGLIEGLIFAEMWDGDLVLGNSVGKAKITPEGIQYLQENSTMQRSGKILKEGMDTIAKLAGMILI